MRIACLYVPDFPLAAVLRTDPELRGQTVAVTNGRGDRAVVVAACAAAIRRGVVPGMSAVQGCAVDASLVVRPASDACRRAAQAALCDAADSFSPRVEDAGEGVVYLDVDGLAATFPTEGALATALAHRTAQLGIETQVGIAATKVAADLAARDGGGVMVIPPGEEWRFLAPMPVGLLAPSPALAASLRRWGIRTIGELAALPASAVGTRLGPEGVAIVRRACGEDPYPLLPRAAPLRFEEAMTFDDGIETLDAFAFVARGLLDRLTARLAMRGVVCGDLHLAMRLANRAHDARTIAVAAPSNDVKSLLALLRLHLEAHPPAAAVEAVCLRAVSERLRPVQLQLFRPPGPAPERLAVTLARLTALCGADRVGAPLVCDSHWPDAYGVGPFGRARPAPAGPGRGAQEGVESGRRVAEAAGAPVPDRLPPAASGALLPLALRALRPPWPIDVFCDRGRPDFVRGARVAGRVVMAAGPWRVQADWWNERAGTRDYYDVQLSDGAVYRLYCACESRAWFADGIYD